MSYKPVVQLIDLAGIQRRGTFVLGGSWLNQSTSNSMAIGPVCSLHLHACCPDMQLQRVCSFRGMADGSMQQACTGHREWCGLLAGLSHG